MSIDTEIKKELRAAMNGILSARMREAGMPFRLIFGVELPRLQSIAAEFTPDADLARQLWEQSIRETRLLAIMLMPPDEFTPELARHWAETLLTPEEAQVMAMMLLPKTTFAESLCKEWIEGEADLPTTCACLCLRHLLAKGRNLTCLNLQLTVANLQTNHVKSSLHLRKAIQALTDALPTQ